MRFACSGSLLSRSFGTTDALQQLSGSRVHQWCIASAFNIQAQHRLGVRAAQIEAPVGVFDRQAVGVIDTLCGRCVVAFDIGQYSRDVADLAIDLAARRYPAHALADPLRQCPAAFADQLCNQQRSEERLVGTEFVSTCKSRWYPYLYKKQQ